MSCVDSTYVRMTHKGGTYDNSFHITFSNLASTKLYGPRNVMEQEYKYLTVLPETATYKVLDEKTLKLITSDGTELTFTRTK